MKPENLIFHGNILKLADFGWSNKQNDFRNTFCGTPDYISPEMIKGEGHSNKLDIWAVGVMVFELLSGKPPFYPGDHIKDKR